MKLTASQHDALVRIRDAGRYGLSNFSAGGVRTATIAALWRAGYVSTDVVTHRPRRPLYADHNAPHRAKSDRDVTEVLAKITPAGLAYLTK